jgi:hypothetical protein
MIELIAFPSGPNLIEIKAKASKKEQAEQALYRLARFYIKMNSIQSEQDIFDAKGRVAKTALEFVENVCETIGYHVPGTIEPPQESA